MSFAFLFCSERSGSNLITSIMNGHGEVSGPPPSHLFRLFGLNAWRYQPLQDDENWHAFLADLTEAKKWMIGEWESTTDATIIDAACPDKTIAQAFEHLYAGERRTGEYISFVKENHTYLFVPFLMSNWPDCQFVYQVRDPRDVAASWVKTRAVPGGVKRAIDVWLEDQQASLDAYRQLKPSGRIMLVRYEDLIKTTQETSRALCKHLGIAYDPAMLNFHLDQRTRRNAKRTQAWENLAKPVLTKNAEKYKTILTKTDIHYVELRCVSLMQEFGYSLQTDAGSLDQTCAKSLAQTLEAELSPGEDVSTPSAREADQRKHRHEIIERVISRSTAL